MKTLLIAFTLLVCFQLTTAYWGMYGPGMGMYPGMYGPMMGGYGYGGYGMSPAFNGAMRGARTGALIGGLLGAIGKK
uniref:Uncharacterized protein n=1 Tax=Syphacia muris TaxID=451379 RepID=A0A0N5AT46_9BILA